MAETHAKKSVMAKKHACVIFKHNKIVSYGYNDYPSKGCCKLSSPHSLHAEMKAILKSKNQLKGCSLLVVRVNNCGELKNSKPCIMCTKILKSLPLKKIYYSNDDGSIECVRKNQLETDHMSFGWRNKL